MPLGDSIAVARTIDAIHDAIRTQATGSAGSDRT
jgi:hypothetical protein